MNWFNNCDIEAVGHMMESVGKQSQDMSQQRTCRTDLSFISLPSQKIFVHCVAGLVNFQISDVGLGLRSFGIHSIKINQNMNRRSKRNAPSMLG